MAERNPPLHLQAGSHPANNDRRFLEQLTGLRPGIFKAGDFAVTQTGTPSMAVSVAAGAGMVDGTEASDQGVYFVDSDGAKTLAIAAADATNARFDMIVARVRDAAYSGATNAWALEVVQGTPASSPVEPAIPANCLVLARVSVAAGASSIINANITDRRTTTSGQGRVVAVGGLMIATAATRPTGSALYEGLTVFDPDDDRGYYWDGAAWQTTGLLADPPVCRVTRTGEGTHTAHANWQAVAFDAETFDPLGMHSNTTNPSRITVPKTGVYLVQGAVGTGGNGNGVRAIGFRVNGTGNTSPTITGAEWPADGKASNLVHNLGDLIKLNAGDWVELILYQDSGGNLSINGLEGRPNFSVLWVGRG